MDTQTKEPSKTTSNEVYKENKGNNHNESQQIISAPRIKSLRIKKRLMH